MVEVLRAARVQNPGLPMNEPICRIRHGVVEAWKRRVCAGSADQGRCVWASRCWLSASAHRHWPRERWKLTAEFCRQGPCPGTCPQFDSV